MAAPGCRTRLRNSMVRPGTPSLMRPADVGAVIAAARAGLSVAAAAAIAWTRPSAAASIAGICAVSGMFFQYFRGMCRRIDPSLIRAGLKMLAK